MSWLTSLFKKKEEKVKLIVTKELPWTKDTAHAFKAFLETELGTNLLCQLNIQLAVSQARACLPGGAHPIEKVNQAYGKQQLLGFILHLARVEPEAQSDEYTEEELNQIVNQMADGGPVIEDIL
jgi:hypothetical protein